MFGDQKVDWEALKTVKLTMPSITMTVDYCLTEILASCSFLSTISCRDEDAPIWASRDSASSIKPLKSKQG